MSDNATCLPPGEGQLIIPGSPPAKRKKKIINLLNRTPSPVILEDYGALEPTRCTVGGPGIAGGIVGIATNITVTARDAAGVHIREGGEKFILELKHPSKGSVPKMYESVDHSDGHYTFTGVRADLKGMHQLSVEVNGSLVGDSPYLVMFEVDDGAELQPEDDDGSMYVTGKTAAASVKEKIVFVQHMNPSITTNEVYDNFDRFGKLVKCERLDPAKDVWMLQYSKPGEAAEAASMNASVLRGCTIEVAVASHMGGVGTHPIILHQLQQIQTLQLQEQQSLTWATQLAQQRASVRQAGGQVEELTDTRKKRKAVALMQRLQAKVAQAQQTKHLGEGAPGAFGGAKTLGETEKQEDLRRQRSAAREEPSRAGQPGGKALRTNTDAEKDDNGRGHAEEQGGDYRGSQDRRDKNGEKERDRDEDRRRGRRDEEDRRRRRGEEDRLGRGQERSHRSGERDRRRSRGDDDRGDRYYERGRERGREHDRGYSRDRERRGEREYDMKDERYGSRGGNRRGRDDRDYGYDRSKDRDRGGRGDLDRSGRGDRDRARDRDSGRHRRRDTDDNEHRKDRSGDEKKKRGRDRVNGDEGSEGERDRREQRKGSRDPESRDRAEEGADRDAQNGEGEKDVQRAASLAESDGREEKEQHCAGVKAPASHEDASREEMQHREARHEPSVEHATEAGDVDAKVASEPPQSDRDDLPQ